MRLGVQILSAACAVAMISSAVTARTAKKDAVSVIRGEVVDLACYLPDGRKKGEAHAACAHEGIAAGNPVGILTNSGELYLALAKDGKPVNSLLEPYAAKYVKITGKRFSRGRMLGIVVEKVDELPFPKSKKSTKKSRQN
jgi:hypothetical protein